MPETAFGTVRCRYGGGTYLKASAAINVGEMHDVSQDGDVPWRSPEPQSTQPDIFMSPGLAIVILACMTAALAADRTAAIAKTAIRITKKVRKGFFMPEN